MLRTHGKGPICARHRRGVLFALAVLAAVALQWLSLKDKIRLIEPDEIPLGFVELRTTPEWRTGYVVLHHGAVLVKMPRNTPAASVEGDAAADGDESGAAGVPTAGGGHVRSFAEREEAVRSIMARELDQAPFKAGLELALYVVLLLWGFFGARRFCATLMSIGAGWGRAFVLGALSWMVGWLIAASPLLACGYGLPLFSNWMGPGALSWSYGYPVSWSSGLTVSYRHFIEAAALWPMALLDPALSFVSDQFPALGEPVLFMIAGLVFYGTLGGILGALREGRRDRYDDAHLPGGDRALSARDAEGWAELANGRSSGTRRNLIISVRISDLATACGVPCLRALPPWTLDGDVRHAPPAA